MQKKDQKGFDRLKSCGRVLVKDHVDISVGYIIDRGVFGDVIIEKGTKLDNLIQVGHDIVIVENCLIVSQSGIAGCVITEDKVLLFCSVSSCNKWY